MLSFGHRRALADRWASRGGGRIINAPRLPKLHLSGFRLMATAEHTALRSSRAKRNEKPSEVSIDRSKQTTHSDLIGTALGVLAASAIAGFAEAATAPAGYTILGSDMGVASWLVLADGQLEFTLADGSVRVYAEADFVVLEGGEIAISNAVAAELAALANGLVSAGVAGGVVTGLVAAVAAGETEPSPAVIAGDTTGDVTEDAAATLETSGTLTVTDADTG